MIWIKDFMLQEVLQGEGSNIFIFPLYLFVESWA